MRHVPTLAAIATTFLLASGCGGGSSDSPSNVPPDDVDTTAPSSVDPSETPRTPEEAGLPIDLGNGFFADARRRFGEGGELTSSVEIELDPVGRQLRSIERATDFQGETSRTDETISLDDDGRMVRRVSITSHEDVEVPPFESTIDYRHDEQGRLVSTTWTRGLRGLDTQTSTESFMWEGGRLVGRSSRPGEDGGSEVIYEYEEEGFRPSGARSTFWFRGVGADREVVVPNTTRRTYVWSPDGRLLEIRRRDGSSNEGPERVEAHEHDANGNPVRITSSDEAGRIVSVEEIDWSATDEPVFNDALRSRRFYL